MTDTFQSTDRFNSASTLNALRVGFFLAHRQLRANIGPGALVVIVLMLTYLNLLIVSGIMVGIVQGLRDERQQNYTSDVILSNLRPRNSIENSNEVLAFIRSLPSVASVTHRYLEEGLLVANYAAKTKLSDNPDSIATFVVGINPGEEDSTTNLSHLIVEGQYLRPDDYDQVLIGTSLLSRYKTLTAIPGSEPLPNVGVGSKVRLVINGIEREMTVKGILGSKVQEVNLRLFMVDTQLRNMLNRNRNNVNEISISVAPGHTASEVIAILKQAGVADEAKIQSALQSEPTFFQDFATTFNQLGTLLGGIGLIAASITVFILVFISAVTRRKYIGILKAIGIKLSAIEIAYVVQSLLYAVIGIALGMLASFYILQPFFSIHPLDFPFSNGVLTLSMQDAIIKALVFIFAIIFASFIPARMIGRQDVVSAMLGR